MYFFSAKTLHSKHKQGIAIINVKYVHHNHSHLKKEESDFASLLFLHGYIPHNRIT